MSHPNCQGLSLSYLINNCLKANNNDSMQYLLCTYLQGLVFLCLPFLTDGDTDKGGNPPHTFTHSKRTHTLSHSLVEVEIRQPRSNFHSHFNPRDCVLYLSTKHHTEHPLLDPSSNFDTRSLYDIFPSCRFLIRSFAPRYVVVLPGLLPSRPVLSLVFVVIENSE